MPPKPGLLINVMASVQKAPGQDWEQQTLAEPSIEIGPSGTLKLFKSFQAYEFNPLGMTRALTSPLAAGAAAMHQSYKISECDVRILRTLGQGASGLVQKALLPREARFAAVKKISVLEREKRHQLMNDIKALCNAPPTEGLIRFYGAYHAADRGQIAVVLEYMDGGSLADVLGRVGRVPEPELAAITAPVLRALAHLHAHHMVHRDIKPANILMSTEGEPKVSDFGISAFVDNTLAQCHTFLGTVTYMSPERLEGKPYSFPADIWALGLTLLECATGRYPYDASGGTIQLMIQLMEEEVPLPPGGGGLSPELQDFASQCMRRDPWARPTAEALLAHPWLARHGAGGAAGAGGAPPRPAADLRAFMRVMRNEAEALEDTVTLIASRLYNNLAWNHRDGDSIAAFYASDALLSLEGQKAKGKWTVAKRLQELATRLAGGGDLSLEVHHLDHQLLEGQPDMAVVQTVVGVVREGAGLPDGRQEVARFADSLTVRLVSRDVLVPGAGFSLLTHCFRWLRPPAPAHLQPPRRGGGGGGAQRWLGKLGLGRQG
eukprot:scaffold20.g7812.t1